MKDKKDEDEEIGRSRKQMRRKQKGRYDRWGRGIGRSSGRGKKKKEKKIKEQEKWDDEEED